MPQFFLKQFTIVVNIKQNVCIYLFSTELDIQHTGAIIIVTIFETFVELNPFSKDVGDGAGYSMVQMPSNGHHGEWQASCRLWDSLNCSTNSLNYPHPRQAHPILLKFFTLSFLLRRP